MLFLTRKNLHCILAPKEKPPHRLVQSKNFISKFMFMSVIMRPRWNDDGTYNNSGKIANCPADLPKIVYIQADNAKPHGGGGGADISEFIQSHGEDEWTFNWTPQPVNSPELNILDLGFFRSIQSKYKKSMPSNIDKIIEEVGKAFDSLHPKTLSNVWMSLQYCMTEIMKCNGNIDYLLPHMKKIVRRYGEPTMASSNRFISSAECNT
ncbi:hypothetical protein RDABS01_035134 [Bienertia sinuspersici]